MIPALAHTMLQSDQLSQEFNEILNIVEIFAPFAPLDPAVTFSAPLKNSTRDLRLNPDFFNRSSDAWYLDSSGIYRKATTNVPRFENSSLLMESAGTNKLNTDNAAPNGKRGWDSNQGGADATHTEVNRLQELIAAGLGEICPSGIVNRFENTSGGLRWVRPQSASNPGNTNTHTVSCWARAISGSPFLKIENGSEQVNIGIHSDFRRYTLTDAPISSDKKWIIESADNAVCEFILEQFEESPNVTSPIITEGVASQRAKDLLSYSGALQFVNDAAGTLLLKWTALFNSSDIQNDSRFEFLGLEGRTPDRWGYFYKNSAGVDHFIFAPSVGATGFVEFASPLVKGFEYKVAYRWGDGFNNTGYFDGASVWGPDRIYTSTLPNQIMTVGFEPFVGLRLSDIQIYNEKQSQSWIEENFFQS